MRYLVVGLGNIGQKRRDLLGDWVVATVDPVNPAADAMTPDACDPGSYDAVVLAVPTGAKLPLLERFLALGKHVLIEKPLLLPDQGTGERLAELARAHGGSWYTSYNHRFEPLVERLHALVAEGAIGRLYHGRLLYGNGTAGNVRGTWRDGGLGAIEDLAPHLIDMVGYVVGESDVAFAPWSIQRHETAGVDQAVLGSTDGRLVLEVSYVCWKNSFAIELFGERGSLHLSGLRKWGGSELVWRRRVLPSGVPTEQRERSEGPDVTWERDLAHFEAQAAPGNTSLENDWWISRELQRAAAGLPVAAPC